jgi:hypothetical protein
VYRRRKFEEGTQYEEILKEFNTTEDTVWLTAQTRHHWVDREKCKGFCSHLISQINVN